MENMQSELEYENRRLEQTIALAEKQILEAKESNEKKKEDILEAKKELRENASHAVGNLWSSEEFEALAEMNQYVNPVMDKIADYEEVDKKIFLLENMVKAPYFARIDFRFEDEEEFEKIYIGKTSLKEADTYEMWVYDWRSPIASVFYRFVSGDSYYDAPGGRVWGEVGLKRQYEVSNGKLEYFFDADVQIVDEFLRKMLSGNTSPKMKTIVETIQREQDIVIRDMENDLMMVQGVAGSGKTSIALHRVAYLMYQGLTEQLAASNIIIISPNSLFEQYISNVLPELGESNVESAVFEEIAAAVLKRKNMQPRNQFLERLFTGVLYRETRKHSIEFKTSSVFREMLDRFIEDLPHQWIAFEDIRYEGVRVIGEETLRKKVTGRVETPLGVKLRQLSDFVLETISMVKGKRAGWEEEQEITGRIRKFTELDLPGLYRKLFENRDYFYSLAKGLPLDENIEEIITYTQENLVSDFLQYDDLSPMLYLHLKIYGSNRYKTIRQVVIDEAQDYYPLQYEIFSMLFPNAKFTVLGDMNQTLGKQEDLSFYSQVEKILKKRKSSLATMDKSFRCTNEILNYSLKFIGESPDIKSFNRNGDQPQLHVADGHDAYCRMLADEVKACQEMGYESIGLICKTEKNTRQLFQSLKGRIQVGMAGDKDVSDLHSVVLMPVYMSKGLEFDAVLICDVNRENYNSEDDKNLLYISCTRALHRLQLFCEGEPSDFVVN